MTELRMRTGYQQWMCVWEQIYDHIRFTNQVLQGSIQSGNNPKMAPQIVPNLNDKLKVMGTLERYWRQILSWWVSFCLIRCNVWWRKKGFKGWRDCLAQSIFLPKPALFCLYLPQCPMQSLRRLLFFNKLKTFLFSFDIFLKI